jgi:MASE1
MLQVRDRAPPSAARRRWLAYLLLALAYTATGKLALMLAPPPGYASPIFPPAGIAVAGMLIGGSVALPWIFFGSLLLNVWIGYSTDHRLDEVCFAAAIVIAAASVLQAAIGGSVLRRTVGYPARLDNGRELSSFLLLSPAFCLTSATLSLTGLLALGVVKLPDLMSSWISWWIGDTLGVLLVLPLMLVIAGEPRTLWRSRACPVALPMLLFFALFTAIFVRVSTWEHEEALLEFRLSPSRPSTRSGPGSKNRGSFSSNWSDPSVGRRPCRGPTFTTSWGACWSAFRRSRRSNGRRKSSLGSGRRWRRPNRAICRGSRFVRLIRRGNGGVPESGRASFL